MPNVFSVSEFQEPTKGAFFKGFKKPKGKFVGAKNVNFAKAFGQILCHIKFSSSTN